MKSLLLSLAALCCTPLFAQHPAAAEPSMPTPPEQQQEAPMRTVMADGSMLLCDSTVTYGFDGTINSKTFYTYDSDGRETTQIDCDYGRSELIWQGEQSCFGWDGNSLYFSDNGLLPSLSDDTYYHMVGKTLCLDIKEVNGEGTTIWVTNGWWNPFFTEPTEVHAGDTFEFEFTWEMFEHCREKGLLFLSNNGLTITRLYWIEPIDPFESRKYERTYDANGNRTSEAYYNWQDGAWVGSSKNEYTYDANGNQTSYASYDWQDGAWVVNYKRKYEYTYDANGNRTSSVNYDWQDGTWIVSSKSEYTYDANGNQTSWAYYNWRDGAWIVSYKYEFTYDAIGNKTSEVSYSWLDGAWVGSYKGEYEYTYYASGHKTILVNYFWQDDAWVPNMRAEWTYDANGIITSNISYHHWEDGVWLYGRKEEWTYDANGHQTSEADYYWQDGAWVVEYKHKYENTYDANGKRTSEAYYNWQNDEWVLLEYTLYYYSLHTPESITQIASDTPSHAPRKQLLPDGRMVIIRDGRSYNLGGQVVK